MSFIKKTTLCLIVPAALATFTGCQQDAANPNKTGTYAAARHRTVGSNIPQRQAVDSTGATYDPDQFSNFQNNQANLSRGSGLMGAGSR